MVLYITKNLINNRFTSVGNDVRKSSRLLTQTKTVLLTTAYRLADQLSLLGRQTVSSQPL